MDQEQTGLALPQDAQANYALSTNVAGLCKEIVKKTATNIQGKNYVGVEGWQAIATAHGCALSASEVVKVDGGFEAKGEVRRIDTGITIAVGVGFVGDDEKTWAGRPEYAKRAMAQTRGMSRAGRSAFAHVVVMMDAGLSTTPAEEVPAEGFSPPPASRRPAPAPRPEPKTENIVDTEYVTVTDGSEGGDAFDYGANVEPARPGPESWNKDDDLPGYGAGCPQEWKDRKNTAVFNLCKAYGLSKPKGATDWKAGWYRDVHPTANGRDAHTFFQDLLQQAWGNNGDYTAKVGDIRKLEEGIANLLDGRNNESRMDDIKREQD